MSLRDKLKAKTVKTKTVTIDGDEYLVKGLSRVAKNELVNNSMDGKKMNNARFEASLLAACVCDPSTGEPVMPDAKDWDIPSHIAGPLVAEVMKVCGFGDDEVSEYQKKSDEQAS